MQSSDVDADQEILVAIEPSQNSVLECRGSEIIAINSVLFLCFCQNPVSTSNMNVPNQLHYQLPGELPGQLSGQLSGKLAGILLFDAGALVQTLLRTCRVLPLENLPGSSL